MGSDSRLSKRQLKKIVKDQAAIVKGAPGNLVALLRLAGALRELGRDREAVENYEMVAKSYARSGKTVQAISVYKGILEISPGDDAAQAALTELSRRRAAEIQEKNVGHIDQGEGVWSAPSGEEPSPADLGSAGGSGDPPQPVDSIRSSVRRSPAEAPQRLARAPSATVQGRSIPEAPAPASSAGDSADRELMAEPPPGAVPPGPERDGEEWDEITSPGPAGYEETIRQSLLDADRDIEMAPGSPGQSRERQARRTLMGGPLPRPPDLGAPQQPQKETSDSGHGERPLRGTVPMGAVVPTGEANPLLPPIGVESRGQSLESHRMQLEDIEIFGDLSEGSRAMLSERMRIRHEPAGAVIIREGDPGDALFVLSSGVVAVSRRIEGGEVAQLARLNAGAFFGEFALLSDRRRHATVTVLEDAVLLEISRKVIASITKRDPFFADVLRRFYRRRLLDTMVSSTPFFGPLSSEEREALMGKLRFRRIPRGSRLITEGEVGGGLFLILIGEVEVTRQQADGTEKRLSRLGDGMYFGEMSLLKGGSAVASVTSVTHTEILQLAAAEFYRVLARYPQIWDEVNREAVRRELANLQILSGSAEGDFSGGKGVVI